MAQEDSRIADQETDEIVVVGRSITTSSSRIEVERELLVDTATALKDIPGADVNSNGPITGIAQYRGMYGDRVSVSIDGVGVTSGGPNAMDAPLSYVSPMITKALVVQRGVASVSTAAESVGGHIEAKIDRGVFADDEPDVSGVVGTRYSGNGGVSTTASRLTLANERHRASILGEYDRGNDIATTEGKIRSSQLNRERYDVSYAYRGENTNMLVFAGRLDTTDTGTPALPMDIRLIDTDILGVRFDTIIGSGVEIQAHFGKNDVVHRMDNYSLRAPPMPMGYRQNLASGSGSHFGLSGLFTLDAFDLRLGIDGVSAEHDSTITNPNNTMFQVDNFTNVDRRLLGVFAEARRSTRSSEFELGLRYNQVDAGAGIVGATGIMGMMGANIAMLADAFNSADRDLSWAEVDVVAEYRRMLGGGIEWNAEIGSRSRAPSYQELFLWLPMQSTGGLADGRTYIGNLDLEAERSNEIVVGVSANSGRFAVSPQLYYKRVDDYIQGVPSSNMIANGVAVMMSGSAPLQFDNVDAEIWGADIAWQVELTDRILLDGVASYTRGRRTDGKDNLYRLAPFNGSVGLTFDADAWLVKTELVAYARQDRVASYNDEQDTAGYWLANLAFSWKPNPSLQIDARLDNIWNESYQDHLAGINRTGGSDIPRGVRLFGAERTTSVGLMFYF